MSTIHGGGRSRPSSRPQEPRGMRPGTRPEGQGDTNIRPVQRQPQNVNNRPGSQAGKPVRPEDKLDRHLPGPGQPYVPSNPKKRRPATRTKTATYRGPTSTYGAPFVGDPYDRPGYYSSPAVGSGGPGTGRPQQTGPHNPGYGSSTYGTRGSTLGGVGQAGGWGGHGPSPNR
jgi:hypothetical protein